MKDGLEESAAFGLGGGGRRLHAARGNVHQLARPRLTTVLFGEWRERKQLAFKLIIFKAFANSSSRLHKRSENKLSHTSEHNLQVTLHSLENGAENL